MTYRHKIAYMKKLTTLLTTLLLATFVSAQTHEYNSLVKEASSLYEQKNYQKSAITYSAAFRKGGAIASPTDYYDAACSWALAGFIDSAFYYLRRSNYTDYSHAAEDKDLMSLREDPRWDKLLALIKLNKEKAEINFNRPLVEELEEIFKLDQDVRNEVPLISEKYGWDSSEMKAHWNVMRKVDSINIVRVRSIIDKHGWLGKEVVGARGNATLFLVIQHSDLQTRKKYLPLMREAVANGKAKAEHLALLEDRVALEHGYRQIYGSQVYNDPGTRKSYLAPLEDPDNVDTRRAKIGLQPLSEYLKSFDIVWDVEQYKKDLPSIEKLRNNNRG